MFASLHIVHLVLELILNQTSILEETFLWEAAKLLYFKEMTEYEYIMIDVDKNIYQ